MCGTLSGPKLIVTKPVAGVTYTLTQDEGGTLFEPVLYSSGVLEFTGLTAGKKFSLVASKDNCAAPAVNCTNYNATTELTKTNAISSATQQKAYDVEVKLDPKSKVFAAPNPFNERIRFTINSSVSGRGTLELYNLSGQKLKTVFEGQVQKGEQQTIEYLVPSTMRTSLIYVFTVGSERTTGKLVGVKQ